MRARIVDGYGEDVGDAWFDVIPAAGDYVRFVGRVEADRVSSVTHTTTIHRCQSDSLSKEHTVVIRVNCLASDIKVSE